jgi:hypothetical protein
MDVSYLLTYILSPSTPKFSKSSLRSDCVCIPFTPLYARCATHPYPLAVIVLVMHSVRSRNCLLLLPLRYKYSSQHDDLSHVVYVRPLM